MTIGWYKRPASYFEQYKVLSKQDLTTLISLDDLKTRLGLDLTDTYYDNYLRDLLSQVIADAEDYTRLTIGKTEFKTFLSYFQTTAMYEIRRAPFLNDEPFALTYIDTANATKTVAVDVYEITEATDQDYVEMVELPGKNYPISDVRQSAQPIRFQFFAGYDENTLPKKLKMALIEHVAYNFTDVDCGTGCGACLAIPQIAKQTYDAMQIKTISWNPVRGGPYYGY